MMTAGDRLLELLSRPRVMREVFQAVSDHNRERYLRNGMVVPTELGDLADLLASLARPAAPKCNPPAVALREGDVGIALRAAAEVLGVSRQRVAVLIDQGRIRALQLANGRWLVSQEDVMAYIDDRGAA